MRRILKGKASKPRHYVVISYDSTGGRYCIISDDMRQLVATSWKIPGTLVCVAALAIAAPSVGTVNPAGSIKINQTAVPASAAVSLPMGLRDKIGRAHV